MLTSVYAFTLYIVIGMNRDAAASQCRAASPQTIACVMPHDSRGGAPF